MTDTQDTEKAAPMPEYTIHPNHQAYTTFSGVGGEGIGVNFHYRGYIIRLMPDKTATEVCHQYRREPLETFIGTSIGAVCQAKSAIDRIIQFDQFNSH